MDWCILDLIKDDNLPRVSICYGDIKKACNEKSFFAVDKILVAYFAFISIYRPHSQSQLEKVISSHVRSGTSFKPAMITISNSGVASLNAVLCSVGGSDKVVIAPNVYYEVLQANQHKFCDRVQHVSSEKDVHNLMTSKHQIDALFLDESWTSHVMARTYFPINNLQLVNALLESNSLTKRAFIVLDITVDTVFSHRVQKFVSAMMPHVASSRITLVLFSSMQKLMQFGLDRVSGGFAAWWGDIQVLSRCQHGLGKTILPRVSLTTFSITLHAKQSEFLKAYVKAVHDNNRYFYELIVKECKTVSLVSPDSTLVYVDCSIKNSKNFEATVDVIQGVPGLYIDNRVSFGFKHTTITEINSKSTIPPFIQSFKIRIAVGACVTQNEMLTLARCYCDKIRKFK